MKINKVQSLANLCDYSYIYNFESTYRVYSYLYTAPTVQCGPDRQSYMVVNHTKDTTDTESY